jgi:hypothetical protein
MIFSDPNPTLTDGLVSYCTVFRIHDILVWIRILIRGSMPLTNGSGSISDPDAAIFVIDLQDSNKKLTFCSKVFEGTVFLTIVLDDRRMIKRIWSRIWIQEALKHVDPVYPDPEYCYCI